MESYHFEEEATAKEITNQSSNQPTNQPNQLYGEENFLRS
jgi:hypothetical protein